MSRPYDSVEPNVIDAEILGRAVEEQGPQEEAGQLAKQEGISFKDVTHLQLDFQNILKIDNLWQFETLTKLQLDNNIIEKIEGLETLTHLIWLDLSFNNIEVIEGLQTLVKLEDLSLFNNRITRIENMDSLVNLQIFSIGNNSIKTLENVTYLRRFKSLRSLNLSGNFICENEDYKMFIAAYLPDLVYLDFRLIDEHTRELGEVKYQYTIDELKQSEAQYLSKLEEEEKKQAELDLHKAAYVEYLNGSFLFDSMYSEDAEAAKLAYLPGVGELLETYKAKFVVICQNIFEYGLKQQEKRKIEVKIFTDCLQEAIADNQNQGSQKIMEFEKAHQMVLSDIQNTSDMQLADTKINEYNEEINQLFDTLMTLEMQIVEQLEETINNFERNIVDMVGVFVENVQGLMAQCRDLENHHHEKLLEIAIITLEKIVKSEFEDDLPDDVRALFSDKDTIVNAVGASHDIHLLKIDNREDDLFTKVNNWCAATVEKVHTDETDRNRRRVKEIIQYIDHLQNELDNLDIGEVMDYS
ncbi:dynein regulatory complex subunit 3 [Tachyglossus aculeatus]|uniref:dynein regulatory complex subunit 3 n=1 Tax=Tachyglossus aculeatus TaxID=9261 RepID=UPI0018F5E9FC|nr:dynein regulatory complex subunit 3 [Tachyglossus aculeatus]